MMKIKIENGDLFKVDLSKYILVHCISLDCRMSMGIAKQFDNRIPNMKYHIMEIINEHDIKNPFVVTYTDNKYAVANLITKKLYNDKPTLKDIEVSLLYLKKIVIDCKVKYLAMPKIASGLDGKDFNKEILPIIERVFSNIDINILIKDY